MKRIVLTGGGTAGHVTPNLALIPHLQADGFEVHYIGSREGIEGELVAQVEGVTYHPISSGKLRRYRDLRNLSDPFRVIRGAGQAVGLMRRIRPAVVFSKGGFVAVPVIFATWLCRIPGVIHESDLSPGLANRLSIPLARRVLTSFPETAKGLGAKAVYTGAPVRESLLSGSREEGLRIAGLAGGKPVLLITGGSQGARAINEAVRQSLDGLLLRYRIIHLCGKGNLDPGLVGREGYFQIEYAGEEMPHLLAAADTIISRAGSNTLFELLALKKPHLLIPLPLSASRGDQIENARSFAAQGFSQVLEQEKLNPRTLGEALTALEQQAPAMVRAMGGQGQGGLMRIYGEILRAAGGRE